MELLTTQASGGLYAALLAVQGKLPHLQKTKINPAFRSKYLPLEELHEEVLPVLNEAGLVWVTQPMAWGTLTGNGEVIHVFEQPCLHYRLIHAETGEEIEGTMMLPLDKQTSQAQGSAITYARRYALMAVLGLVADEDDDGNKASGSKPRGRANAGKRETRSTPAAQAATVTAADMVKPGTLAAIKSLHEGSGISNDEFATILRQAGVAGQKLSEIPEEKAQWVLVALREHVGEPGEIAAK